MLCSICNKPIILVPSASERARKFGGRPSDYTKLFTTHSECLIKQRSTIPSQRLPAPAPAGDTQ